MRREGSKFCEVRRETLNFLMRRLYKALGCNISREKTLLEDCSLLQSADILTEYDICRIR